MNSCRFQSRNINGGDACLLSPIPLPNQINDTLKTKTTAFLSGRFCFSCFAVSKPQSACVLCLH